MTSERTIDDTLKLLGPRVLGVLARRSGDFGAAEDAVQEALIAACRQWPEQGVPEHAFGWLLTVASRRLTDQIRVEAARKRREATIARLEAPLHEGEPQEDDVLLLLFMCCHPALTPASQLALTLRAVGGLTTAQIAHACLAPEATMAQRISRAKQSIRAAGAEFRRPAADEWGERLSVVLHVLYLIFNEGYASATEDDLLRPELTREAIRLMREVRRRLPVDGEVAGLLALMLLTDARRPARLRADGGLIPLDEQDRSLWNRAAIDEGRTLIEWSLATAPVGPYQLQAAIAALHGAAANSGETDWPQICALYGLLESVAPNPVVSLNRIVALGMARGPKPALQQLAELRSDGSRMLQQRIDAARGHLLELDGRLDEAQRAYREAAARTANLQERRFLHERADRLGCG